MAAGSNSTSITQLDEDSLAHCARHLSLRDVSNFAMTCKFLKDVAYSDSIWRRLFREQWPRGNLYAFSHASGVREAYISRHAAIRQFKFVDPFTIDYYTDARPFSHVVLGTNDIIISQGAQIHMLNIDGLVKGRYCNATLADHSARVTCMRLFSLSEASFFRSESKGNENVLITSSADHSIRIWWKGSCQRCFRGHDGPVSTLSDKILGDGDAKVFASGGEDATVRFWSLGSSSKRGQHALRATLRGHEKAVKLMSVAGHKSSLLVTVAKDSKIRLWDSMALSAASSSFCVGNTSFPGVPIGIKCHEALVYVAAGSSTIAIDVRTLKKAFTVGISQSGIYSFDILPSKSLVCTGGNKRALLWDIRKSQGGMKREPVYELYEHNGPVMHVHMDPYKIVTGGPFDFYTYVWDMDTGKQTNSLSCSHPESASTGSGCDAMAIDGSRIVTTCSADGLVRFRDFTNAFSSVSSYEDELGSKFWNKASYSDTESEA
ncbi:hypothetical protein Dimus_033007 [Dionaea muscipula]